MLCHRCNKGEAQELSVLPHIEALVASSKLIVWPWVSANRHSSRLRLAYSAQLPKKVLACMTAAKGLISVVRGL